MPAPGTGSSRQGLPAGLARTMQDHCLHLEEEAHVVAQLLLVVEVWRLQPTAGHHLQQISVQTLCSSREKHAASWEG